MIREKERKRKADYLVDELLRDNGIKYAIIIYSGIIILACIIMCTGLS